MKKTKVIIPALAVLLLSTAASVTGTVAWFSMNNSVTVTGMTVTTKVSSNLLIAETNAEANYQDSLQQARNAVIEPSSSINAQSFFWTTSALGNGDAITDAYTQYSEAAVQNPSNALGATDGEGAGNASDATKTGKTHYDPGFNTAYGFTSYDATANSNKGNGLVCFAYVDYSFYIKATSAADDQILYMSECNLLYNGGAITSGFAWRVGLLSGSTTTANTAVADNDLSLKTILGLSSSKYQNQNVENHSTDSPQAVKTASTLDTVSSYGSEAQAATDIDSGVTNYTRIIVRLWLEGEDISCTNTTYAELTQSWTLSLKFELGASGGVQAIGSTAPSQQNNG